MSKLSKQLHLKTVTNYMNGESFTLDPLTTLKMVCASSIFGEPQYYRSSKSTNSYLSNFSSYFLFSNNEKETTEEYMERIIDAALDYDFLQTIEYAKSLRQDYNIRINPQVIMVRAAIHPKRVQFNKEYPTVFMKIQQEVMLRADEPSYQLSYYLSSSNNKKNNLPSILKRSWAQKLSSLNAYQVAKYKNHECGMINTIRICHAHSDIIDELMQTGKVCISDYEKTWQNLRSENMTWKDILSTTYVPHMALLKNLSGIFTEMETNDTDFAKKVLKQLVNGVENGKQFPYRYYNVYKHMPNGIPFKEMILDAIEECLQISLNNMPYLEGKTMVLSDNSGSAWGTLNTEYGSVKIAEIGNLSAVLTAMRSNDGYVGVFGDKLYTIQIDKNDTILNNLEKVNILGQQVGFGTENGLWIFLENAITNTIHWDNLFIYSDMQAGRGELYCLEQDTIRYQQFLKATNLKGMARENYINVLELLDYYRSHIHPNLNVFSIQTAGYDNNVLPNYLYRGALLTGWTGKEALFAKTLIDQWNQLERKNYDYS
ncbi:MAG: hypothetical protein IJ359_02620 [Erysipelotrichaceae bacterium]|nr:hypothetical protein [Erysipelotrichaceae bacterium]